jgi:alpha-galactosidase
MMHAIRITLAIATIALLPPPAAARARPPLLPAAAGTTLRVVFDRRVPRPGVRLLELTRTRDGWRGQLTSDWYGTMPMQRIVRAGPTVSFDIRNINTPGVPVRRWTATVTPAGVVLAGGIWDQEVRQTGRRARAAEAAALAHRAVPLPALHAIAADGLAATPPMGWSSWNRFADRIDDRTIRAMADAMVSSGLRDAGYRYVNIDDGWQGDRGRDGALRPNARFPDMKALADYVHARGLKLGLYSSPGLKTCAGYIGSYGHVAQDARTFARWGVDYLKYDLCSGEWQYADADGVRRAYQQMGAALKATGRPIVYSLCEYGRFDVAAWGRSVGGHLWRTTGDITDDYAKMSEIGFVRNPRFGHAGPGGWNDPDMLEIGNGGMSADEYRTHMTLWAMSAAPLMMGHDLRTTDPAALALLSNRAAIAIDQDPAGVQGKAVRVAGQKEIWTKRLADGAIAVALFNRGEQPATMTLAPGDAGVARLATLRDVWRQVDVDPASPAFVVPPHGVVFLRATGER